jgi:hypothetical protein
MKWRIKDSAPEFNPEPGQSSNVKNTVVTLLFVVVFIVGTLLLVFWKFPEVTYKCQVDTEALGSQSADLCNLVPESIRKGSNVVVTGGYYSYPTVFELKDIPDTVFYNVLTSQQQIGPLVNTPKVIQFLNRFGFFGGVLGGLILVPILMGIFRLVKKISQERQRSNVRKERKDQVQQRQSGKQELDFVV